MMLCDLPGMDSCRNGLTTSKSSAMGSLEPSGKLAIHSVAVYCLILPFFVSISMQIPNFPAPKFCDCFEKRVCSQMCLLVCDVLHHMESVTHAFILETCFGRRFAAWREPLVWTNKDRVIRISSDEVRIVSERRGRGTL